MLAPKYLIGKFWNGPTTAVGNTVRLQAGKFDWADLVTVHALPGPGLLDAVHEAAKVLSLQL